MKKLMSISKCYGCCWFRTIDSRNFFCDHKKRRQIETDVFKEIPTWCELDCENCKADEAARLERKRCLAAVEQEEEFDGGMPDELFTLISCACGDREYLEKVFRSVVSLTKQKIKERIEVGE